MSLEHWITYTLACTLIILSPGPDNILAVSRGLSQGRLAAVVSSVGAGAGLLVHVIAATFGLAILVQTSDLAFGIVKIVGAAYLIWLGINAIKNRDLISFSASKKKPMKSVLLTGFLTNVLNPKPVIFILAFVPQFVSPDYGSSIAAQSLLLGVWFAVLAFLIFALAGCFASVLARWLEERPGVTLGLNIGAGTTLVLAGMSIALLDRR